MAACGCSCILLMIQHCRVSWAQDKRKVIIDQDAAGPGGTDQQSMLMLIQSPQTDVLGITVVTGDDWLTPKSLIRCACSKCWAH